MKDVIFQKLDVSKADILKEVPNLKPEHYLTLVNLLIGHEIGKAIYAGLEFPLEDDSHLEELMGLSNNYLEFGNVVVRICVTKLKDLEETLSSLHQAQKYTHFVMIIFLNIKATEKLFRRRHYVYDLPSQAQRRVRAILGRTAFKKAATIREPSRRIDDFIAVSKTTEPTPPKGPRGEEESEFD